MPSTSRRPTLRDYPVILEAVEARLKRIQKRGKKGWLQFIDVRSVMSSIMADSWIVNGAYLVMYSIHEPWYNHNILIHSEVLVLKLRDGAKFSDVTDFLERTAREAGAVMTGAGTALARSDNALASLYVGAGYEVANISLSKTLT